jgi:hypothetical protein
LVKVPHFDRLVLVQLRNPTEGFSLDAAQIFTDDADSRRHTDHLAGELALPEIPFKLFV